MFERNKGLDALDELQKNPNKTIYDQAQKLLTDHFEVDEEGMEQTEISNNIPNGNGNMFNL